MGFFERLGLKKEEPLKRFVHALEASGAYQLLQKKAEELDGRIQSGTTGQWLAWQELSWARQHSTDKAKRLRVQANVFGVKVSVSRAVINELLDFDAVYTGAKPFDQLTLQEKVEIGTRLAEPILQSPVSNSPQVKV